MPKIREYDEDDDDIEDLEFPFHERPMTLEEADAFIDKHCSVEPSRRLRDDIEHSLQDGRITFEERDEILRKSKEKLLISDDLVEKRGRTETHRETEVEKDEVSSETEFERVKKDIQEYGGTEEDFEKLMLEIIGDVSISTESKKDVETASIQSTKKEIDLDEVLRLHNECKFSPRKVAETLGVSRYMIQKALRALGCKPRPVGGVEKNIDPHEVHRICVEEGRSKKEAAEILGCKSIEPINRILQENDWKTPLEVKMETEIDPDEAFRLHYEEGWSFIRIANHYGYESKDTISRMFKERDWIPTPIARRVVYEFPPEIEEDHRIESSRTSDIFEHLGELEDISPLDMACCIENLMVSSSSESRVKWVELSSQTERDTKITQVLANNLTEIETSLNERLDISEDSTMKIRVGYVDGKLYIREQDTSEYNWMNIYENELFYFNTTDNKSKLVHEMRARLGLGTNTDLGKLIDQLTDRESAEEGNGYSDIKECQDDHLRTETLHLILDTTGQKLSDIQEMIHCIGKTRSGIYDGKGGIRNPRFPTDPETIDIMFAKFFGLGLTDGHLSRAHQFVYSEKNPDRRKIVIQHSKDFGDIHYHERVIQNGVSQIQFACAFGRALQRKGFPVGDKGILNSGIPEFVMHGSLKTICTFFSNVWPEDGCFIITDPNNRGEFAWDCSVVVRDPLKESKYDFESEVTEDHLTFFERYGTYIKEDADNGFKEMFELSATTLEELTKSESLRISSIAKEIKDIVCRNEPNLLVNGVELLHRIGVHATRRFQHISYLSDSSRVSVSWRGRIQRKEDVMRTALLMPPDDIRKRAKVEEWISLNQELRRRIESELKQL
ncbi:MAG: hypothetical protein ACTSUO_00045 [Candidatus Thorarchaeota archaeon]